MSERWRTGGAPTSWEPAADPYRYAPRPEPVDPVGADPTARHAFDEDAAMTPIFTALRRGNRPRPPARFDDHRDPVDRFRRDPPTAPIPLPLPAFVPVPVPAPGDRAAPFDPAVSRSGGYRYGGRGYGAPGDDDLYEEPAYEQPPYAEPQYDPAGDRRLDAYAPASFGPRPADRMPTGTADFLLHDPRPAQVPAWRPTHPPRGAVLESDTGRHHRRLAPAGW